MRHAVVERDVARIAVIVIHGEERHRLIIHVARFAIVVALESNHVVVAPARVSAAARQLMVQVSEVGHFIVAELAQKRRVGVARKRRVAGGLIVAIGINQRHPFAHKIIGVLQFAMAGVIVVMALRVHHAHPGAETAKIALLQAGQRRPGIAQHVVEIIAQRIIQQPHARIDILTVAGRLAQVLAENQRVVARRFRIEVAVAMAGIAEAVCKIELQLRAANIARGIGLLVCAGLEAEKIARHVLDRIQTQAIALGLVDQPAHGAEQICAHVFLERVRIRIEIRLRDIPKAHARPG